MLEKVCSGYDSGSFELLNEASNDSLRYLSTLGRLWFVLIAALVMTAFIIASRIPIRAATRKDRASNSFLAVLFLVVGLSYLFPQEHIYAAALSISTVIFLMCVFSRQRREFG